MKKMINGLFAGMAALYLIEIAMCLAGLAGLGIGFFGESERLCYDLSIAFLTLWLFCLFLLGRMTWRQNSIFYVVTLCNFFAMVFADLLFLRNYIFGILLPFTVALSPAVSGICFFQYRYQDAVSSVLILLFTLGILRCYFIRKKKLQNA